MTLQIRWDASDTTYISGGAGERYVHFPLEVSSTIPQDGSVTVTALDSANNVVAQQDYPGIPLTAEWVKFSPAILIADTAQITTLKALIYTTTVPIAQPRLITKSLGGFGGSMKWILGGALLYVALKMFKGLKK